MKNKMQEGFTLVELLVVIAIISILAAIVVPRVSGYISKGNMTKVVSEIENAETAVTALLSETGKSNFRQFFTTFPDMSAMSVDERFRAATDIYTTVMYTLLRQGRNADPTSTYLDLVDPDVLSKVGTGGFDLGKDAWGQRYNFYAGPLPQSEPMIFRAWRPGEEVSGIYHTWLYNDHRAELEAELPGNPPRDLLDDFPGYPAARNLPVYIWSFGEDKKSSQLPDNEAAPEKKGGGDDINNWDNESGWKGHYG